MWTPEIFATDFKKRWEGGLSLDPADRGNWVGNRLVGSNFGVTAAALARHRGVDIDRITIVDMRKLTMAEAGAVALGGYYRGTGIDLLPWNQLAAAVFDFGYNAGPKQAIETLQQVLGLLDDGRVGKETIAAAARADVRNAAIAYARARHAFYEDLVRRRPTNAKYLKGWKNRANYFRPDDAEGWWARFSA